MTMPPPDLLQEALKLSDGARFFRCALQVNPFAYLAKNGRKTAFSDEKSYNDAIIDACKKHKIEVIAITDHHSVKTAAALRDAAAAAGITVFPGFEAGSKDGVHVLCLFDPTRSLDEIDRIIGECGIRDSKSPRATGKYDVGELLDRCKSWDCLVVPAHVNTTGGLIHQLEGDPRVRAWCHPELLAVARWGKPEDVTPAHKLILENKDPQHRRDRVVAIVEAHDVSAPEHLAAPGAACFIKMTTPSLEGLRQAFLDPDSRIRSGNDAIDQGHSEVVAVVWEGGGFLEGQAIHFNENLNVLVGGRGAGKSTVIESLRYALGVEPLGSEAKKAHEGVVKEVLGGGTKVSILIRKAGPSVAMYRIERTVPNPPVVKNAAGELLSLKPLDLLPRVEIFGQHEIAELARSAEKRTRLLGRFVDGTSDQTVKKSELRRQLENSRTRILQRQTELRQTEERLAGLPALEETLRRFKDAGLEEKLKDQSLLVREQALLAHSEERITTLREAIEPLRQALPADVAFLSDDALKDLPARATLARAADVLRKLATDGTSLMDKLVGAVGTAATELTAVRKEWSKRKAAVDEDYEKILRDLQKSKVDGEEFMRLRRQVEVLRPLKEKEATLKQELGLLVEQRRTIVNEWEDARQKEWSALRAAARSVSNALERRAKVTVTYNGDRRPLEDLLDKIPGRLSEAKSALLTKEQLSVVDLVAAWRAGADQLVEKFGLPRAQAEKLAQVGAETVLLAEELDLPSTTSIELNVAPEGVTPEFKPVERLSKGQKATAVLLLMLLANDAPLIVDQPEDDLDNRFITEGIVPKMREEKRRRQFIFSTHNANIPVLGDAELLIGLEGIGEADGTGRGIIPVKYMGSMDAKESRDLAGRVLEGGKTAFETRRLKYGY